MKKIITASVAALLGLAGCVGVTPVPPQEVTHTSALIVWKTPQMKYADMGFIEDDGSTLKVEIYSSGTALMRLNVGRSQICMSTFECLGKAEFNRRALSGDYPPAIIENIFRGKPLYGGEGLVRNGNGFTQKIVHATHEIEYSVDGQTIDFMDIRNNIHIKVTKI